jgi:hypothetical protein
VYKAARKREFERIQRFEDEIEREGGIIQFAQEHGKGNDSRPRRRPKTKIGGTRRKGRRPVNQIIPRMEISKAGEVRLKFW